MKVKASERLGTSSITSAVGALLAEVSKLSPSELTAMIEMAAQLRSRSDEEFVILAAPPRMRQGVNNSGTGREELARTPMTYSLPDLIVGDHEAELHIIVEAPHHAAGSAKIDASWRKVDSSLGVDADESESLANLAKRNEARKFELRKRLFDATYSADHVASMLGRTKQAILDRAEMRDLLAIKDGKRFRFPAWQFDGASASGVVEGLPDVLKAATVSSFALASWLSTPHRIFGNKSPIDTLRMGNVAEVVSEARAIGSA